jgi:MFS transporter, FHS family, L-fucose permease
MAQSIVRIELGTNLTFIVPGICLGLVACYALFDLRATRHGGPLVSEGAAG